MLTFLSFPFFFPLVTGCRFPTTTKMAQISLKMMYKYKCTVFGTWPTVCCHFSKEMSLVSSAVSPPPSGHAALHLASLFISCFYFVSCIVGIHIAECSNTVTTRKVPVHHQLTLDFYAKTCPQVEQLVGSVTTERFRRSPVSGPATIRLFFHDCFVDVSVCSLSILFLFFFT